MERQGAAPAGRLSPGAERLFLRLSEDALQGPESQTPPQALRAFAIDAPLRGHVAQLLAYREDFPAGAGVVERVLPDGALRLVFHLGDAPQAEGEAAVAGAAVIGASTAPALLRLHGRTHGLSLLLRPGAARALLGVPAAELAGQALPLAALWGGAGEALAEAVATAPDDAARAALLQRALARRLARVAPPDDGARAAAAAVGLIERGAGLHRPGEVARALGLGERRLQQLCAEHLGLPPRALARLARLQAVLRSLRRATPAWADAAAAHGYADQSHLVREFRALCGLTPGEFLVRRRISDSSKTG